MIPHALFNSKGLFNPYQYEPFSKIYVKDYQNGTYDQNGNNILITDEVGVGKTFEAGIILQEVIKNNSNSTILIICPPKLASQWQSELYENFCLAFDIYEGIQEQLTIVPYSKLDEISEFRYDVLVLDEAHYIRNNGTRHKAITNLNEANSEALKVFMTATPIFNSEADLNNITALLGTYETTKTLQGEANLYDFQLKIINNLVDLSGKDMDIMDKVMQGGFGNLTGFIKRVATSSIYSLKTFLENRDTFDDEHYWDEYEDDYEDVQNNDGNLDRLKELCDEWTRDGDGKLKQLITLIESIKEDGKTNNGIVLFSSFINTGKYLFQNLNGKYSTGQISGQSPKKDIEKAIKDFKYDVDSGKTAILICSDAFKEGQNFQFCDHLIHYDFPFTPAAMGQRNGRIYRTGRKNNTPPTSYYITVNNSYDNRLFGEIIVEKAEIINSLSDQGKISILNVLPSASNDFLEASLKAYFEERVSRRQGDDEKEKREFLYQIRRKFYPNAKKTDANYKDDQGILDEFLKDGNYEQSFINIFSKIDTGKSIFDTYSGKYDEQFSKINEMFFGDESSEKSNFIESCKNYLSDKNFKKTKFCHDIMRDDALDYGVYKNQFVALCEMEKEKDNE